APHSVGPASPLTGRGGTTVGGVAVRSRGPRVAGGRGGAGEQEQRGGRVGVDHAHVEGPGGRGTLRGPAPHQDEGVGEQEHGAAHGEHRSGRPGGLVDRGRKGGQRREQGGV